MINNRKFTINYIIISFFIVLISIISFSLLNSNVNAVNLQLTGSGTASNPYKIYNRDDLINFSEYVNSGGITNNRYFELKNNINLTTSFTPIGTAQYQFRGHFNGGFNSISNLNIFGSNYEGNLGLFGYATNATIEKVIIASGNISLSENYYAGAVVGQISSGCIISNCANTGLTISSYSNGLAVGGIVGGSLNYSNTVTNCFNYANLSITTPSAVAGGIVGLSSGSLTIEECFNHGTITANSSNSRNYSVAGGIIGDGNGATIRNSYNRGAVTASNTTCNIRDGSITNYNFGMGITQVRERRNPRITRGVLAMAGGISGKNGNAYNCYNTASVRGGYTQTSYTIYYSFYYINITVTGSSGFQQFDTFNTTIYMQCENLAGAITGPYGNWSNCFSNGNVSRYSLPAETQSGTYIVRNRRKVFSVRVTGVISVVNYTYNVMYINNSTQNYYELLFDCSYDLTPGNDGGASGHPGPLHKPKDITLKECSDSEITSSNLGSSFASSSFINNGYPYIKSMFWHEYTEDFINN